MRLLLLRHGESEWNAVGRWQGQADPPLSDQGRAQAVAAAAVLGPVVAIVASPLQRAAETAAIISAATGVGPVVHVDDLKERDAGEWSGLTRAEIDAAYPGWLDGRADEHVGFAGQLDRGRPRPPGWETDESVLTRARAALDVIHREAPDGDVLVITHGGLVYTLERFLGADFARLGNLDGRWLESDDGDLRLGERESLLTRAHVPRTVPDQL